MGGTVTAFQTLEISPDLHPDLRSPTRFSLGYHLAGFQTGKNQFRKSGLISAFH
jgi:hypothetical protein